MLYLCFSLLLPPWNTLAAYTWSSANNIPDQLLSATKIISACWWNAATSLLAVISSLIMLIDSQVLTFSSHKHSHHSFQKRLWSPSLRFHIKARKRIHEEGGAQRKVFSHPKHRNIPLGSAVHVCLNMKNVNALPCITLQCVLRYLFT